MKVFFVLFFMGAGSFSVHAKTMELKKDNHRIYIEEKSSWSLGKELFGMPFIYFSPLVSGQRSNISFTDTGAEVQLDVNKLAADQKTFQENKNQWAKKIGARTIGFDPYQMYTNKHQHKIHSIGFQFQHEGKSYVEKSYYIECRGKILFSKGLRLLQNEQHEKDFKDLIESLDCGGV